jgi:hypothetical protein
MHSNLKDKPQEGIQNSDSKKAKEYSHRRNQSKSQYAATASGNPKQMIVDKEELIK